MNGRDRESPMDTELARTLLSIVAAGSFVGAAERLYVTQSTVSARIHALEEHLCCTLFVRHTVGTTLTPARRQFEKHARSEEHTYELQYLMSTSYAVLSITK